MHASALIAARPGWSARLCERLQPGAYIALLSADQEQAVEARRAGLELRDTILFLWPMMTSFGFLLRAPATGGALERGRGVLNIQGCRISWGEKDGRWPSNVVLIHGPDCRLIGETKIEGHKGYPNGPGGSSSQFSQKGTATTRTEAWAGHADADGKETIPVWECQEDCPARLLDVQSGVLKSGNLSPGHRQGIGGTVHHGRAGNVIQKEYGGDVGGASRYYPQFASPWELLAWLRDLLTVPGEKVLEEV